MLPTGYSWEVAI
uniref:Uncharacterized protein n=1 Tax=Rhizophora mucronata TaxID=61149 RepID=A0A2P2R087_RHIMU